VGKYLLVCLFASFLVGSANAAVITLDATDNGWYRGASGYHYVLNNSIYTGTSHAYTYHSFYNFDVSSLAGLDISSVEIIFEAQNGDYHSHDQNEILSIFDVHSHPGLASSLSIFNDLGSGVLYGQTEVYGVYDTPMPEIRVLLSESSIADILANSFFSVGGACRSCTTKGRQNLWFNSKLANAAKLQIQYPSGSVPEAPTFTLIGIGFLGFGSIRRKQKNSR